MPDEANDKNVNNIANQDLQEWEKEKPEGKIINKTIIVAVVFGILLSLFMAGYFSYWFKDWKDGITQERYEMGISDGRQQISDYIIDEIEKTGELKIKVNTSEGNKMIILKIADIQDVE